MLWSIKTKDKSALCLLQCLQLVCILWTATNSNGCHFGHHCCRRMNPNSIKHEVNKIMLISKLIYWIKQNPLASASGSICARLPAPWVTWIHWIHAAGGASGSTTMVVMFIVLCCGCVLRSNSSYIKKYQIITLRYAYHLTIWLIGIT